LPFETNLGWAYAAVIPPRRAINMKNFFIQLFFRRLGSRCFCKIPGEGQHEILLQYLVCSFRDKILVEVAVKSFTLV
jgi:hypothetical protein